MLKSMLTVLFLPVFIIFTILSPIIINKDWVRHAKERNEYESFWKTWWKNIKEIWTDDII